MNRYHSSTPRAAFLFAALALSALTLAVSVVVPAALDSGPVSTARPIGAKAEGRAPIETAVSPGHIDVVVLRDEDSGPSRVVEDSPRIRTAEIRDLGFISVQACSTYAKRKHRAGSA
jgi:hypothetical protein